MDNKIRNKNIILAIVVLLVGFLLAGGTYAYLTRTVNVTNGNINAVTTCFDIDYTDTNQITGTLFPSANHTKGLTGTVSLKVNNACDLEGVGKIYIHVNSRTSNKFGTVSEAHCEDATTLEQMKDYSTINVCKNSNSSNWIENGTVLKYAIYDNAAGTGTPLSVGYFDNANINGDWLIYSGFAVTQTQKNYYIFLWLDGNLTDNTYTNLIFDGYVRAEVTQKPYKEGTKNDSLPDEYQQVEYIESHGDECMYGFTALTGSGRGGFYLKYSTSDTTSKTLYSYYDEDASSHFDLSAKTNYIGYIGNVFDYHYYLKRNIINNNIDIMEVNYLNSNDYEFNGVLIDRNANIYDIGIGNTMYEVLFGSFDIFEGYYTGSSSIKLYEFKRSKDSIIVNDYVPCYRKNDNVIGLYDVVDGAFYINRCSGTFGKGSNIY